jgi:hypothetical protein
MNYFRQALSDLDLALTVTSDVQDRDTSLTRGKRGSKKKTIKNDATK